MPEADVRPGARAIERMVRQQPDGQQRPVLLEAVCGRLALGLWQAFRRLAGDDARVALESCATTRFADYRSGVAASSLLAILEVEASAGLVVLDSQLVDAAIELLLGGGHVPPPEPTTPRAYTPADEAIVRCVVRLIIGELAKALDADGASSGTTCRLVKIESNPCFASVVADDDLMGVGRFETVLGSGISGGMFDLVLPRSTFEPFRKGPRRASARPGQMDLSERRMSTMPDVPITLHAVVDRIRVPLLQLARWEAGSLIALGADGEQPVTVYCERGDGKSLGRAVYAGRLGASRGRRAIRVVDVIEAPLAADGEQESAST